MLTRLMVILFLSPTTLLGLWGCGEKTMSPELARQAASFYATATALAAESPTPVDDTVRQLREQLQEQQEEVTRRLASDEAEEVTFEGPVDVPGKGIRDGFRGKDGKIRNCEELGLPRPTRCIRIGETPYWMCDGQILRDCPECPEPMTVTPGATVVTATPPPGATVVTATPPPGATVVTATPPPGATATQPCSPCPEPTTIPTLKPIPTNEPPGGTATCEPCISSYKLDELTGQPRGFWVQESSETCAFEHRTFPAEVTTICPQGGAVGTFVCTVDNAGDVTVSEGVGQAYYRVYGATIRFMPAYAGENVCTVFRNEFANSSRLGHPRMPRFVPVAGGIQSCP